MIWRTKNGRVISVSDMSLDHLRNARSMVQRVLAEFPDDEDLDDALSELDAEIARRPQTLENDRLALAYVPDKRNMIH